MCWRTDQKIKENLDFLVAIQAWNIYIECQPTDFNSKINWNEIYRSQGIKYVMS